MKVTIEARDKFTEVEPLNELIADHVEDNSDTYSDYEDVELVIYDVSQVLGSGYGTWRTVVDINDDRYALTHHSEDWYLSQKVLYNEAYCFSEIEYDENIDYHNTSVYRCIEANLEEILKNNQPKEEQEEEND